MSLTKADLLAIKSIVDDSVDELRTDVAAGFAEVDQRFQRVDERFAMIDERFQSIDERLEYIDKRFLKIDERFRTIESHLQVITITTNRTENTLRTIADLVYNHNERLIELERAKA